MNASCLRAAGGVVKEAVMGVRGTVAINAGSSTDSFSGCSTPASLGRRPTADRQCRIAGGQPSFGTCRREYDISQYSMKASAAASGTL